MYEGKHINILFHERPAGKFVKSGEKIFYTMREELENALSEIDLSNIELYTTEKINSKINFTKSDNQNALEFLRSVLVNDKKKIPIKSYLTALGKDDGRVYYILFGRIERRFAEDVATKLLAKNLAYKVLKKDFVAVKKSVGKKYFPISAEEYKKIVAELKN